MIYEGKAVTVKPLEDGIVELNFDLEGESVNKFNRLTVEELGAAAQAMKADSSIKGMIVTSAKSVFIVGADITEFGELFTLSEEEIAGWCIKSNQAFNAIEDLPFPTVTAMNGIALGGGLEMCLATDFRVMSTAAQCGLPEAKLGLYPGFGGTVRMPRIVGVDNAVEWIAAGGQHKPEKALKDGVVDAVVEPEKLRDAALSLVKDCIAGKIDYRAKRQEKLEPLKLPPMENMMAFQTCSAMVMQQAGRNYPAPMAAVQTMQQHAGMTRDKALEVEAKGFAKVATTSVADSLIGLFLNDQILKKVASKWEKQAKPVNLAAVLGAGIMGGGIAFQSASKGTPIIMKDINEPALELGMSEATKLLAKRVERKKMQPAKMGQVLSSIRPTLNYGDFQSVDIVVEAVVENVKVKQSVLADVEKQVKDGTILASNTSTISITKLAEALQKPENFVGMHFFNPVHMMPLVEVIRGEKSSDEAVATTVAYAKKMGKTPVVVNDCPGFLVNRVLFPYFGGFGMILRDGADFQKVDKVMERFGWPMGPAYLMDVVGIDTGVHAAEVMAEGFPERMQYDHKDASEVMFENKRYGQKNGVGFYKYETDKKGKPKKVVDETTYELIKPHVAAPKEFEDQEIIDRLMIPMCLELVRCLEENIVSSVADADMALIMGIGFPPFRGGALKYIDSIGVKAFVELCDQYKDLGPLYEPTAKLREMAANGESFYK
ncbi:MAG: fatty acid oxidation complex subunit alpha FadB [Pseudomonadales bacterium]|jgi:3-hydroxyacyl-CoA dehydrogenase / enoyl-CoA hydratase / 3-hydroxybutyryl-CoA epimerase / enoyl-CoA isomerase|nr:fatty acid oxidation complex subunit alpha FadB [Pseudomonadales bacterium]MBI26809.1 fatty acid oxidation complex subunit alpha FadB [Pseudomonadales bacterium]MEC8810578.1 fatty acid oxidation complex subunit alpha FadB [Pseudomonadota bacterium]HBO96418.1 fatty acid oxidation complex subunit alpha FadB [Gammaproteobacteria bacterium]|tara:strand:+ start:7998 stop:10145 length:2148 start_codon:yes stop_codon:yes gene_type:complete